MKAYTFYLGMVGLAQVYVITHIDANYHCILLRPLREFLQIKLYAQNILPYSFTVYEKN